MTAIHIIDDEPNVLRLMGEALHKRGYSVETFSQPDRYLEQVRERPDLLITDLLMPGLDGIGFCQALRSSPAMRTVPIIVVTGLVIRDGMRSDQALRERFGVQAIINKPFALRWLFECVERTIGPATVATGDPNARVVIEPETLAQQKKQKNLAAIPLRHMSTQRITGTRFDPRYDVALPVSFGTQSDSTEADTENISRGGLFVRTHTPPEVGTTLRISVRPAWEDAPIVLGAVVAHAVTSGPEQRQGFGCRLTNAEPSSAERWYATIARVAEAEQEEAIGPRVLLLGFSGERVADLMHQAGILCRSDLRIVPLATWDSVLREAQKNETAAKLLVVDVGQCTPDTRATLFNTSMLRKFADIPNVALAYIGLGDGDDRDLPTELHVIRAGALTSADLVGAIVSWLRLPERAEVRVPATGAVSVVAGERSIGAEMLDVSLGGARFLARDILRPGEKASLTFRLGMQGEVEDLSSVVRWSKPEGRGRWMFGVVFSDERDPKLNVVVRYIEEQARYLQSLEGLRRG